MQNEAPGLEAKLQFLRAPASHANPGLAVGTIETHMSWLFMVGERVLKLKKPVRHDFLDFSSVDARGFYCREEVRLNRRLAPGIYLGVMALQWDRGAFALLPADALPAPGVTVDWLVQMRRLPAQDMLDRRIAQANVAPEEVDALVAVLAAFYRSRPGLRLTPQQQRERFGREHAANRAVLQRSPVPGALPLLDRLDAAFARHAAVLDARASGGHIVEGHGDLRIEHVCLTRPPVIIDCLEFKLALRQVDPFDEIVFLGLECTLAGAPWIARRIRAGCTAALEDQPPQPLIDLYTAHRAMLRTRLAMSHLLDPVPRTPEKLPALARRYLEQARLALDRLN